MAHRDGFPRLSARSVFTSRNFGLTEPGRVLTYLIPVGR